MKRNTDAPGAPDGAAFLPAPDDLRWLLRSVALGSMSAAARERDTAVSQASRAIDRRGVSGTVRLAVSAGIAQALLLPVLPALLARHPGLQLALVADDRVADLPTEGIDLAMRSTVGGSEQLSARPLGRFQRGLYASPAYLQARGSPQHPDELPRHTLLTHTGLGQFNRWRLRVQGRVLDLPVGGGLSASSSSLMQQMAEAGLGIALLSRPVAVPAVARSALIELLARHRDPRWLTMYAVALPGPHNAVRIRAVGDFLAEVAASHWGLTAL